MAAMIDLMLSDGAFVDRENPPLVWLLTKLEAEQKLCFTTRR
ncbi:hypothetical protein [Microcoleus sp. B9-D4]